MTKLNYGHPGFIQDACRHWDDFEMMTTQPNTVALCYKGHTFGYWDNDERLSLQLSPKIVYELKEDLLAQSHALLTNSRWITFRVARLADVAQALWLLKIAYLYHRVQINRCGWGADDVPQLLDALNLSPRLRRALTYTRNNWYSTQQP